AHFLHEFYFEAAAMILALITLGKMLEARSKGRTTDALKGLMSLAPDTATIIVGGQEKVVPVSQVKIDDVFVIRAGDRVPVDGIVVDGHGSVDESALTGESIPVDKQSGDRVSAATTNKSGYIRAKATRVGEDTTLSQIIKMVSDASATKAPIAKIADKVSGVFVPVVITIALITFGIWLAVGQTFGFAIARGVSVLVISCPCALGLATPVAIMVGSGKGAKNGILFKTAVSLEEAGKIKTVALDKTGTITKGQPAVTDVLPADGVDKNMLAKLAYALEAKSEHPLSHAIVDYAKQQKISLDEVSEFTTVPGRGLCANYNGKQIYGGNLAYISQFVSLDDVVSKQAQGLAEQGKTPLFFAYDNSFLGIVAVGDVIKEDSADAIAELKQMGVHVVMLTGDNSRTAKAIGEIAGVDEVVADVLPGEKERVIKQLSQNGKIAMVGDGINDAPALTRADIGMAIGAGADVAVDAADVVLMNSQLSDVPAAIKLSRATLRIIKENLFWAFIYNVIGIPLAA
ncbi:MAG: cadmium-translocating P-type ATPase, partial [Clostridia bacterium]|nr:cadmium-translocating P-type ATPase [Clostridia bacterium]